MPFKRAERRGKFRPLWISGMYSFKYISSVKIIYGQIFVMAKVWWYYYKKVYLPKYESIVIHNRYCWTPNNFCIVLKSPTHNLTIYKCVYHISKTGSRFDVWKSTRTYCLSNQHFTHLFYSLHFSKK